AGRAPDGPRDTSPAGPAEALLRALVRPHRAAARPAAARRRRVHVPPRQRAPLPGARGARRAAGVLRLPVRAVPALRRGYRGAARGRGGLMATTLSDIRSTPGLDDYLDALEERLARTVATHPGLVAAVGNEGLAAGGERVGPGGGVPLP